MEHNVQRSNLLGGEEFFRIREDNSHYPRYITFLFHRLFFAEVAALRAEMGKSLNDAIIWVFTVARQVWDAFKAGHLIIIRSQEGEDLGEITAPE